MDLAAAHFGWPEGHHFGQHRRSRSFRAELHNRDSRLAFIFLLLHTLINSVNSRAPQKADTDTYQKPGTGTRFPSMQSASASSSSAVRRRASQIIGFSDRSACSLYQAASSRSFIESACMALFHPASL